MEQSHSDAAARRTNTIARHLPSTGSPIVLSPDVREALRTGEAVVALESTIITHGMPYPQNLATAQAVESVVRTGGAVPATVAVLAGVPHVGLTSSQLEHLAKAGRIVHKTSRRDLAAVMAKRIDGATTVSATMLLAAAASVRVFVTGGVGGVHRGGEDSLDVSADLTELGRTRMTVVCAGVKKILDIPRTLEVLETQGVTVAVYGSDDFPAFFSVSSGCAAPLRVDGPAEVAAMALASERLGLASALLIAVPIPAAHQAAGGRVDAAIQTALQEAAAQGVRGAGTTPFLLQRVAELTGGASLAANIELVLNNARVGAQIAVAMRAGGAAGQAAA